MLMNRDYEKKSQLNPLLYSEPLLGPLKLELVGI